MMLQSGALALTLFLSAAGGAEALAAPLQQNTPPRADQRGASWAATMVAARQRLDEIDTRSGVRLGPWYATRPLPASSFTAALFPERGVDLHATDARGGKLWRRHPEWTDGQPWNLPGRNRASTYLYRTLHSARAQTCRAAAGSDDGIEVWLNGAKILSHDTPRGLAPDQEQLDLELRAGTNHLLLKIHNNTGGHGFYFALGRSPLLGLWGKIEADFPLECSWMRRDLPRGRHLEWFREGKRARVSRALLAKVRADLGPAAAGPPPRNLSPAQLLADYAGLCRRRAAVESLAALDLAALRRAVEDLARTYPDSYPRAAERLARVRALEGELESLRREFTSGDDAQVEAACERLGAIERFRRAALLANPLLSFERLLLIKRRANSPKLGLPQNWQGNCSLPRRGFEDEIALLGPLDGSAPPRTFFKPPQPRQIADLDLDFDASRMIFSMIGSHDRWQIWELDASGRGLHQITPGEYPDVDNYDACYLPDGRIIFDSTRCFQGIPCVGGKDQVANLFLLDAARTSIRQLCFDQDHDWCPAVLNNGRVLYTRWEYSDSPHYFTRLLMHMNPDGTGQMEYYGSNSFWPNSTFYARPIPGHPTEVVAIISGHHGAARMGELVLFDPARGRHEADGVVQRIPGWGRKVEPVIADQLVRDSWPRFLHPFPLSGRYFLTACQPAPGKLWGIYLVDIFDNLLCLAEEPGFALLEPIPLQARTRPPSIPDKVDPSRDDATVYLGDVYRGPGLASVPRGTVEKLRVYEFHYSYNKMGGHKSIGIEGPWDVHRILGTVPVRADGSASFRVPANTPLAIQPLDSDGQALALMRSWFTAMPGEVLSCMGCHERQSSVPPVRATLAARRPPAEIEPWYGPPRGFSFAREVQPVLDRRCVGCHDGRPRADGQVLPNFRRQERNGWHNFTPAYIALHPYVRRPGPESDYHLQQPLEFHASTSELIQMLRKGHHGVELQREEWDRLITWIDLNVPDHGSWAEQAPIPAGLADRRRAMRACYAARPEDPETLPPAAAQPAFIAPREPRAPRPDALKCEGWPFDAAAARRLRERAGLPAERLIELGAGLHLELVLIPAGSFLMGSQEGFADEAPRARATIERPFYMGRLEITREQFNRFDPAHHNGYHDQNHKDHTTPGYPANGPHRPVIRVSWLEAMAFCRWLSERSGMECTLPTEAEWEWACRAGTATPFFFGGLDADFGPFANLADRSTQRLAVSGVNPQPIRNPSPYEDWLPKEARFDDGQRLMCDSGRYRPNAWDLHDMHGNVREWTLSDYRPYPYLERDGRNSLSPQREKVVRGGSWRDRPRMARSSWRWGYRPYQRVFDVGFRVVVHPAAQPSRRKL